MGNPGGVVRSNRCGIYEKLGDGPRGFRKATEEELLTKLKNCGPEFFELIVVQLLRAMGYGGINGEGNVTGKPGDGGIDGGDQRG
jgi:restriction system protein